MRIRSCGEGRRRKFALASLSNGKALPSQLLARLVALRARQTGFSPSANNRRVVTPRGLGSVGLTGKGLRWHRGRAWPHGLLGVC